MTVKIGLISDVHATPDPVQEALTLFQNEGVDTILCAGDLAGYGTELEKTVELLINSKCRVIIGNHDRWCLSRLSEEVEGPTKQYLRTLPTVVELTAENKKIYMVHASPPQSLMEGIKLLNEKAVIVQEQKNRWEDYLESFPYDVLVVGHTHQVFAERLGSVLVINPGSTKFNHTCAILTLPEMTVQIYPLLGKKPLMAWNWGIEAGGFFKHWRQPLYW